MKRQRSEEQLLRRLDRVLARAPSLAEVMRGTLRQRYVRCGKPGCHCERGKGHGPFVYLSVTVGVGRTVQITVDRKDRALAERYVRNYRRLQDLLERISEINRELLRERLLPKPPTKRKVPPSKRGGRKATRT